MTTNNSESDSSQFVFEYEFDNDDEDSDFVPVELPEDTQETTNNLPISNYTFSKNNDPAFDSIFELSTNNNQQYSSSSQDENDGVSVFFSTEEINLAGNTKKSKRIGISKKDREDRYLLHKTHLLSLVASTILLNRFVNHPLLKSWSLSLLSAESINTLETFSIQNSTTYKKRLSVATVNIHNITNIICPKINSFFTSISKINYSKENTKPEYTHESMFALINSIETNNFCFISSNSLWIQPLVIASILRTYLIECRMVFALQPVSLKVKTKEIQDLKANYFQNISSNTNQSHNKNQSANDKPKTQTDPKLIPWCEILDYKKAEWICIHTQTGKLSLDPILSTTNIFKKDNPYPYIFAIDKTSFIKDITEKHINFFTLLLSKYRIEEKFLSSLINDFVANLTRSKHNFGTFKHKESKISRIENKSIQNRKLYEVMPTRLSDFLNHPYYVLLKHLKTNQMLNPKARPIAYFRGTPVYPRTSVYDLFTKDQWLRKGRQVKEDEQPTKVIQKSTNQSSVQQNPLNKRKRDNREIVNHSSDEDNDLGMLGYTYYKDVEYTDPSLQGTKNVYGLWQTQDIVTPELLENGKIPRNKYNKIDLFHEKMLPRGTTHIPIPNFSKVCIDLKVDFVEATTKFRFEYAYKTRKNVPESSTKKGGRMVPVTEGVVVLEKDVDLLLDAYKQQQDAKRKQVDSILVQRAIKNWKKMYISMETKHRLFKEYLS
ncbi:hypothetical protein BB558_000354 [Smittium angustum]|uniref:Rad4 beta-hairpin domain-containing protein n=1 Tax=Smittium angustum TaxID=133377 RepID=A0A2U1JEH3_SMIAN|nr:hypothetical protein BB558_000354 [Smittium angustum]